MCSQKGLARWEEEALPTAGHTASAAGCSRVLPRRRMSEPRRSCSDYDTAVHSCKHANRCPGNPFATVSPNSSRSLRLARESFNPEAWTGHVTPRRRIQDMCGVRLCQRPVRGGAGTVCEQLRCPLIIKPFPSSDEDARRTRLRRTGSLAPLNWFFPTWTKY